MAFVIIIIGLVMEEKNWNYHLPKSLKVKNPISLSVCVGLMNLGILNFGIRMEVLRKNTY